MSWHGGTGRRTPNAGRQGEQPEPSQGAAPRAGSACPRCARVRMVQLGGIRAAENASI